MEKNNKNSAAWPIPNQPSFLSEGFTKREEAALRILSNRNVTAVKAVALADSLFDALEPKKKKGGKR